MALKGISVLELAGLAPVPFAGMVLGDFGAKVVRIDRPNKFNLDVMGRGKRSIAIDLKRREGVDLVRKMSKKSDVIIEPFRPGVMEKLGLGPEVLMNENPRLVYARLSGFGQNGPYKYAAGHDINYIATSGILHYFCRKGQRPYPPLNIVADFAGGGLTCAFGVLAALFEREKSGKGQIVDTSMVAGSAYVSSFAYLAKDRMFTGSPGSNLLDTGAPFYDCYETKDGRHVAVGALEPQFYEKLIKGLGLNMDDLPAQMDPSGWPKLREAIGGSISKYTMKELEDMFDGKDACLCPVLTPLEAARHRHNLVNDTFFKSSECDVVPSPAPLLSRTPARADQGGQPEIGAHTREVLLEYGFAESEISKLESDDIVNKDSSQSKL